jgi:hypothetical protein
LSKQNALEVGTKWIKIVMLKTTNVFFAGKKIAAMPAISSKNCEARTTKVVFELEISVFGYVLMSSLCYLLLLKNTVLRSIKT